MLIDSSAAFDPFVFFLSYWSLLGFLIWSFSSPDIWMLEYPRAQFSALFSVFIDSTRNLTGLMKEISEHFKRNVVLGLVKVERSMFLVGTSA